MDNLSIHKDLILGDLTLSLNAFLKILKWLYIGLSGRLVFFN